MNEAISRILEATRGENPEQAITQILDHERKAAADAAQGVEDVTAGLKSALEKTKKERESLAAEREALTAKLAETETAAEKLKREAESKEHGVDDAAVEKLAEKRAEAMAERSVQAAQEEAKRAQSELETITADRAHLVNRLETAYVDLELLKSGADGVNPLFYPVLRTNARTYLKLDDDAEGDTAWWRRGEDQPPRFAVVDPEDGKTRLQGKSGPMKSAELLADKRTNEWADFWPRTDRGPGGSTIPGSNGDRSPKLDPMTTPGVQLLEEALSFTD